MYTEGNEKSRGKYIIRKKVMDVWNRTEHWTDVFWYEIMEEKNGETASVVSLSFKIFRGKILVDTIKFLGFSFL